MASFNNRRVNKIYYYRHRMLESRKWKTQKSPGCDIRMYKSTQLKEPYYITSKHEIVRGQHNNHKDTGTSKSMWMKCSRKVSQSRKEDRQGENNLETSKSQYHRRAETPNLKPTQNTRMDSQSRETHYRIEDLLGINSNISSKKTSFVVTHQVSRAIEDEQSELDKLRAQNKQLMRVNELLLYEKEYYKQKTILQEVQIREFNRRLEQQKSVKANKGHYKNKSESQDSDLTFKFRAGAERCLENDWQKSNKHQKLINLAKRSEKSSLLVSESDDDLAPLKNKQNKENIEFGLAESNSHVRRTQKQFSELLESVQNENNLNRKATLRKMLAVKAMQLKKVKQRS